MVTRDSTACNRFCRANTPHNHFHRIVHSFHDALLFSDLRLSRDIYLNDSILQPFRSETVLRTFQYNCVPIWAWKIMLITALHNSVRSICGNILDELCLALRIR